MSSESPRAAADLSEPSSSQPSATAAAAGDAGAGTEGTGHANGTSPASADFGANEWLVDELYQRYLADPGSVDRAWWSFFADYRPSRPGIAQGSPVTYAAESATAGAVGSPATGTAPAAPASPAAPAAPGTPAAKAQLPAGARTSRLRGAAARTVTNMESSLSVPTATSVRAVPAKLLIDNRIVVNNHLQRGKGGKVSFTHLIGYAVVRAATMLPAMNCSYAEEDGKPVLVTPGHVSLGLAIDLQAKDGSRQLLVPSIKAAEEMDFRQFWNAYEDVVRKARGGKLTVADFQGTTISLTNPGTIGTEHSVPRLMPGQGTIIGVGAMEYPAAYQGASEETMARLAISKTVTLTST
ncbi:MAG TPA: 2-oxo acid dehydrogenase subunit E2, partial [Trebonia sp.]|nr:2-oxo acid dehydrogenase subunit E2 [Trebonia sp.]